MTDTQKAIKAIEIAMEQEGIYVDENGNSRAAVVIRPALETALLALREKLERVEPRPLTLEELRQMGGKPVWVVCEQCITGGAAWCVLEPCEQSVVVLISRCENRFERFGGMFDDYGKTWVAYRYPPEGAADENH